MVRLRACLYEGELLRLRRDKQALALLIWNQVTRHLLHDCRMAQKHKNDLSRLKR
jgi:hypothetical protein